MDPAHILSAAHEAIVLLAKLPSLLRNLRSKKDDPRFKATILHLYAKAEEMSGLLTDEIRIIINSLRPMGIDTSKSLPALYEDSRWMNWTAKRQLKDLDARIGGIYRRLALLSDDVETVFFCLGEGEEIKEAYFDGSRFRQQLDEAVAARTPLVQLLKGLLEMSEQLREKLKEH